MSVPSNHQAKTNRSYSPVSSGQHGQGSVIRLSRLVLWFKDCPASQWQNNGRISSSLRMSMDPLWAVLDAPRRGINVGPRLTGQSFPKKLEGVNTRTIFSWPQLVALRRHRRRPLSVNVEYGLCLCLSPPLSLSYFLAFLARTFVHVSRYIFDSLAATATSWFPPRFRSQSLAIRRLGDFSRTGVCSHGERTEKWLTNYRRLLSRNFNAAATAILLYDFFLTLGDEKQRVWEDGTWSGAKALWFGVSAYYRVLELQLRSGTLNSTGTSTLSTMWFCQCSSIEVWYVHPAPQSKPILTLGSCTSRTSLCLCNKQY